MVKCFDHASIILGSSPPYCRQGAQFCNTISYHQPWPREESHHWAAQWCWCSSQVSSCLSTGMEGTRNCTRAENLLGVMEVYSILVVLVVVVAQVNACVKTQWTVCFNVIHYIQVILQSSCLNMKSDGEFTFKIKINTEKWKLNKKLWGGFHLTISLSSIIWWKFGGFFKHIWYSLSTVTNTD